MKAKKYSKDEIFEKICIASRLENLGLFIGSGFSKAILLESHKESPSWKELLERMCDEFRIDKSIFLEGFTYPLIASKIIETIALDEDVSKDDATGKFKTAIAKNVNILPSDKIKKKYKKFFDKINPEWIVTTNYDRVIEQVVGERAYPILPGYSFYNTKNILPVYHIHGSVNDPKSIVIANEDYAETLRPSDYRHSRLPILLAESTVLMIGYAIGDLNVISAIDYKNNVFKNVKSSGSEIIQLVYTSDPKEECYEHDGIIVFEYSNLDTFLTELLDSLDRYESKIEAISSALNEKSSEFANEFDAFVPAFASNKEDYRKNTVSFIYSLDNSYCYIYSQFMVFLGKVFDSVYAECRKDYQFSYYNDYLNIWFDLMEGLDEGRSPTVYLTFLTQRFDEIAYHIGNQLGEAYAAYQTWKARKHEIPKWFLDFIMTSINELSSSYKVKTLLKADNILKKNESASSINTVHSIETENDLVKGVCEVKKEN